MSNIHKHKFAARRVVLLVEVERYCQQPDCLQLNRIALTKDEAREYFGFTCVRCETWNEDILSERDIPDWWEEIMITDLVGIKIKNN